MLAASAAANILSTNTAAAQGFRLTNGRNHPELDWRVAETAHVRIVYPSRLAGIETEAAPIAEATYAALSRSLGVAFDHKLTVYLSDEDEIVNGTAVPLFGGYTTIWAPVAGVAEGWTGRDKWLRRVIAHEMTHLFHYRAVRPSIGLLGYALVNPTPRAWTEGLAQYETERWDAFRGERYLRVAAIEGRPGGEEGASPWAGGLLYAAGHSQVRVFAETYGDSALRKMLAHRRPALLGLARVHDPDAAMQATVGVSWGAFEARWRRHVIALAGTRAAGAEPPESLAAPGTGRRMPLPATVLDAVVPSPRDSGRVAVVRLLSLARPVRDLALVTTGPRGARVRVVAEGGVEGLPSWAGDGRRLAFARSLRGRHGSIEPDVFVADVGTGMDGRIRTTRITTHRRATLPAFSPDGTCLAFVVHARSGGLNAARVIVRTLATGAERAYDTLGPDTQAEGIAWQPAGGTTDDGRRTTGDGRPTTGDGRPGDGRRTTDDGRPTTGDERPGDQRPAAPDQPTCTGALAVSLFGPDGARAIHRLDLASGALTPLTDGRHDDRTPVFSPDGRRLAFTSLRDGVPNVFVLPMPVPGIGRPSELPDSARVTRVAQGATAHAWLAGGLGADSPNAEGADEGADGHLVLTVAVSKSYDAAYRVQASRRVAAPVDLAPPALSAWERRPSGAGLPGPTITAAQADSIAGRAGIADIVARSAYRSVGEIRHVVTLPFPYLYDGGIGIGGVTAWLEPLGKHLAYAAVGIAPADLRDSYALASYRNAVYEPTITVEAHHFPRAARVYGANVLAEREAALSAVAAWPLGGQRPYAGATAAALARLSWSDVLNADDFDGDVLADGLERPESGTQIVGGAMLLRRFQRPWRDAAIHPLDGTGLRLSLSGGAGLDRRTTFARTDAAAYAVLTPPGLPGAALHRLYLYGRATAQAGRSLAQDYVGLARYDGLRLFLPSFIPVTLEQNERVRGYRRAAVGNVALFGTAEYRVPLWPDAQTTLFGAVRLGALSGALFADVGVVARTLDLRGADRRLGVGGEVKNVVSLAGYTFGHALGVAQPADRVGTRRGYETYYRIQLGVPF